MPLVKNTMNGCKISCSDCKVPLLPQTLSTECTTLTFSPTNSNTLGANVRKGSVRGNKLAKRARSFKDDFLEKISQIRTPTNTIARSNSPNSPKGRHNLKDHQQYDSKTAQDLNYHVRQVKHALTHFKDVIIKKKLEMLHGNGTVVLESITNVHTALKSYKLNEYSSALISSTQQVHLALAKLIKLCDEVLLSENEETCSSLNQENVTEIVLLVENAVQNLVILANEKIAGSSNASSIKADICNSLQNSVTNSISLRTSLPDIPLTQRERDILEQTAVIKQKLRTSNSTESVIRNSPPAKPTKMRSSINLPPPLPPKTSLENSDSKSLIHNLSSLLLNDCYFDNKLFLLCNSTNPERISPLSRSFEDNFDQISTKLNESDFLKQSNKEISNNRQLVKCNIEKVLNTDNSDSIGFIQLDHFSSNESGLTSMASHCSSNASTSMSSEPNNFSLGSHLNVLNKTNMRQQSKITFMDSSIYTESSSINTQSSQNQIMTNSYLISDDLSENMEDDTVFLRKIDVNDLPPPLPVKKRNCKLRSQRLDSQYDNVEDFLDHNTITTNASSSCSSITSVVPASLISKPSLDQNHFLKNKYTSCIEPRHFNHFNHGSLNNEQPPPLPMKKKHIMAYMEIFGNSQHYTQDTNKEAKLVRHSMHTVSQSLDIKTHVMQQQNITLSLSQTISLNSPPASPNNEIKPPLLPPKRTRINSFNRKSNCTTSEQCPKLLTENRFDSLKNHPNTVDPKTSEKIRSTEHSTVVSEVGGNIINNFNEIINKNSIGTKSDNSCTDNLKHDTNENQVVLRHKQYKSTSPIRNLTEETDIRKYLVLKKKNEDGPDIKGGQIDALIVHATKVQKFSEGDPSENAFGEAFLTTFRTFINPYDLIDKLTKRYIFFQCQISDDKQRAAKESFSLLVRVVNDLTFPDLNTSLMQKLVDFVYQLVCFGELLMAKLLRVKLLEKASILKQKKKQLLVANYLPSRPIMSTPPCLLDLKSTDIAEQMTLLDAQLFFKIEIPEVLIWAREQNEESSPNLTLFTEHFNKMSYWARTQILKQQEAKDREKFVFKFIKIMKHLRKINNYNSYLALLSALDSAPVRRLEWQKTITEGLKEYCALIDSSSSFRAYRQALSETNPPCIPYIGLVLQDLTFVHIGNTDYLADGAINFSKRWQQYNIVVNMKRFRKGAYGFKKNERIIGFFDNFEDYFDEDAMWQISEKIKPRGVKK